MAFEISDEKIDGILSGVIRKLFIFQVLPDVCEELFLRGYPFPRDAIVVVFCPWKSLVDSHIHELTDRGITCASLRLC